MYHNHYHYKIRDRIPFQPHRFGGRLFSPKPLVLTKPIRAVLKTTYRVIAVLANGNTSVVLFFFLRCWGHIPGIM